MDVKSSVYLEVEKNERVYRFEIPNGAPYGEAVDTAFECFVRINEMAQENFNKAKEEREKAINDSTSDSEKKADETN